MLDVDFRVSVGHSRLGLRADNYCSYSRALGAAGRTSCSWGLRVECFFFYFFFESIVLTSCFDLVLWASSPPAGSPVLYPHVKGVAKLIIMSSRVDGWIYWMSVLQLQLIITVHTLNSLITNLSRISSCSWTGF
jgi:hypothetical protein